MFKFDIYKPSFEEYNVWDVTYELTKRAVELLSVKAGISDVKSFMIINRDNVPMCSHPSEKNIRAFRSDGYPFPDPLPPVSRIIVLNTEGVNWCQWIYQFSHEACHHLIDGSLSGELIGSAWFEETLCEVASLFCLSKLSDPTVWHELGCPLYALAVQSYLDKHLQSSFLLREEYYRNNPLESHQGIKPWIDTLEGNPTLGITVKQRNFYSAVASLILPAFLRTPGLWSILPHIGDSRRWPNLEALFSHLEKEMPPEHIRALHDLRCLLLGSD